MRLCPNKPSINKPDSVESLKFSQTES
jgi:hypothetical protein